MDCIIHGVTKSWIDFHFLLLGNKIVSDVQFSSLSCVRLFATPWTAACQARMSQMMQSLFSDLKQ